MTPSPLGGTGAQLKQAPRPRMQPFPNPSTHTRGSMFFLIPFAMVSDSTVQPHEWSRQGPRALKSNTLQMQHGFREFRDERWWFMHFIRV